MGNITLRSRLQKVGITGTNLYVTRPVQYSTITERDIVNMVSDNSGINKAMCRAIFDALVIQMEELILNGHSINLQPLGTFSFGIKCKSCSKPIDISARNVKRRRLKFRPSTELRKKMYAVGKKIVIDEEEEEGN